MKIKAEIVDWKRWDWTYGSCKNRYKCPCGKNCIVVEVDNTPGYEHRIVYFDYKNGGECYGKYRGITEDYNSFVISTFDEKEEE